MVSPRGNGPANSAPVDKEDGIVGLGAETNQGERCLYLMERDLERKAEQALVAITLSTATLIVCVGLLVLR